MAEDEAAIGPDPATQDEESLDGILTVPNLITAVRLACVCLLYTSRCV